MQHLSFIIFASFVLLCTSCSKPSLEQRIANLPVFPSYRAAPYIAVAGDLQKLDQQPACDTLMKVATKDGSNWQVVILSRMLFTKRPTGDFRRARLGAFTFLGDTDYADWPRGPIEIVDGVPFFIVRDYQLEGQAEPADAYLNYCMTNCAWSSQRFAPKTSVEMTAALGNLVTSATWKRPLNAWETRFLTNQLK